MNTRIVKRGEIYFVNGKGNVGSEQNGNRFAIIVSNNVGNKYSPVVQAVYVTCKLGKAKIPTHVYIESAKKPCIALCEQIHTIDKTRLVRCIGTITERERIKIDNALAISIGLDRRYNNA